MNSKVPEEDLPIKLEKLEIAPLGQIIKLDKQMPINLNPFYNFENPPCNESLQSVRYKKTKKKHRFRRRSESHLDDYKDLKQDSIECTDWLNSTRSTPKIQKQPLKKFSPNSLKRFSLREPMLRSLHNSLHLKNTSRRPCQLTTGEETTHTMLARAEVISNFHDLINECNNLINHNNRDYLQESKSFTTLRIDETLTSRNNRISGFISDSIKTPIESTISKHRSSITCSQEAAGSSAKNSSSCDDVTINELASYFDTMVHIPKKMSSMAEMMYI